MEKDVVAWHISSLKIRSAVLLSEQKSRRFLRTIPTNRTCARHALDIGVHSESECYERPHIAHSELERAKALLPLRVGDGFAPEPLDEVFERDDHRLQHEEREFALVPPRDRVLLPPVDAEADEEGEIQLQVARGECALPDSEELAKPDTRL